MPAVSQHTLIDALGEFIENELANTGTLELEEDEVDLTVRAYSKGEIYVDAVQANGRKVGRFCIKIKRARA